MRIRQKFVEKYGREPVDLLVEKVNAYRYKIKETAPRVFIFGYAVYLLLRFIQWAVKTLK